MKLSLLVSKIVILNALLAVPLYAQAPRLIEQETPGGIEEWISRSLFPMPVKIIHKNGQVIISGSDPLAKVKVANEIRIWLNAPVSNFNKVNWTKDINITPMINPKLKKFKIGKPLPVNGINCHGTSLYLSGLLKRLTYVGENEMTFYIKNNCEKVPGPEANTIGIYDKEIDSHSYKIISPGLTFQKGSVGKNSPFKLMLIQNYGHSEFFRCKPTVKELCSKHQDLKSEVDKLDELYSRVLNGIDTENRNKLFYAIEPLATRVGEAIQVEANPYCKQDLLSLKYRLESLHSVGEAILGEGLFRTIDKFSTLPPKM